MRHTAALTVVVVADLLLSSTCNRVRHATSSFSSTGEAQFALTKRQELDGEHLHGVAEWEGLRGLGGARLGSAHAPHFKFLCPCSFVLRLWGRASTHDMWIASSVCGSLAMPPGDHFSTRVCNLLPQFEPLPSDRLRVAQPHFTLNSCFRHVKISFIWTLLCTVEPYLNLFFTSASSTPPSKPQSPFFTYTTWSSALALSSSME